MVEGIRAYRCQHCRQVVKLSTREQRRDDGVAASCGVCYGLICPSCRSRSCAKLARQLLREQRSKSFWEAVSNA